MRIGLIGCGNICDYHAAALRAVGFQLAAVCSRAGSRRPHDFALRHGIARVFDGPEDLFSARNLWDALLIAVPPEATLPLLQQAVALGVPVLVEKPGGSAAVDLKPFAGQKHPVIVGYNRRFYAPVRKLRQLVSENPGAFLGHLVISEPIGEQHGIDPAQAFARRLVANSVHALDLLRFIFGPLEIDVSHPVHDRDGKLTGISALVRACEPGSTICVSAAWNVPANLSLTLFQPGLRAVLEPLEELKLYREMQRIEPTSDMPLRRYVPLQCAKVGLAEIDFIYKPGFLRQAEALRSVALGEEAVGAATLDDAYHALVLAEGLLSAYLSPG